MRYLTAALVLLLAVTAISMRAEARPNVILIMADDKYHDPTPTQVWIRTTPWKYTLFYVVLQSVANRDLWAIAADSVELTTLCYSSTSWRQS